MSDIHDASTWSSTRTTRIVGAEVSGMSRPVVTGEDPANHVFVDLNVER
jgi:hypothetical protein